jgi:integrase
MARQRLPPQIKRRVIGTDDKGREVVRYEVIVDLGFGDDRRRQTRRRFRTETEARAFLNPVLGDKARGTHVAPSGLLVKDAVARWLRSRRVDPKTLDIYTNHLRPVVEVLGDRTVQSIDKDDIEDLVQALIDGTTPRGVWAATTINPMLNRLRSVYRALMADGKVFRNPADLVENIRREDTTKPEPPERTTYTAEQCQQLLSYVQGTEDDALVALALMGLRRSEIAGLRWSAVDLDTGIIQVTRTRTVSSRGTRTKDATKTATSTRVLELDPGDITVAFLKDARRRQRRDRLAWGSAWKGPEDGYVVPKADGSPFHPATVNRRWIAVVTKLGLPKTTIHEGGRHTAATLMLQDPDNPEADVAAWLGHANAEVTRRVYAHAQDHTTRAAGRNLAARYDFRKKNSAPDGGGDTPASSCEM